MSRAPAPSPCCGRRGQNPSGDDVEPLTWFGDMVGHCHEYATRAVAEGRPVVGIMCEARDLPARGS